MVTQPGRSGAAASRLALTGRPQDGIMPLLLLRSAMVLRLWLARVALLASFFLRSWVVSRLCPWPRGLPATAVELSCRYLREEQATPGDGKSPLPFSEVLGRGHMARAQDTPVPTSTGRRNGAQQGQGSGRLWPVLLSGELSSLSPASRWVRGLAAGRTSCGLTTAHNEEKRAWGRGWAYFFLCKMRMMIKWLLHRAVVRVKLTHVTHLGFMCGLPTWLAEPSPDGSPPTRHSSLKCSPLPGEEGHPPGFCLLPQHCRVLHKMVRLWRGGEKKKKSRVTSSPICLSCGEAAPD